MKLLIVVTHLLGSGHLSRALTLGQAFAAAGHQVSVASGGMPVPQLDNSNIDLVQLPPLRSDGVNFTRLLDRDGQVASQSYLDSRQTMLSDAIDQRRPDVLITELFPFGRRALKKEFQSLLHYAKNAETPLILSSIRDILAPPSKPAKAVFADDMIGQFYDGVLVHSDAAITPLSLSWPVTDDLAKRLHYTGFVAPEAPQPHPEMAGSAEVMVSAGGGDVGEKLFQTALQAAALDQNRTWRMLIGGPNAQAQIATLAPNAPDNATIEAARPDFRQMLNHAAISVSMCGYNTALDVLQTGVPAVFVPFDEGGEIEQSLRAKALAERPNIQVLNNANMTASSLLSAVNAALSSPTVKQQNANFDGAASTVRIVTKLLHVSGHA